MGDRDLLKPLLERKGQVHFASAMLVLPLLLLLLLPAGAVCMGDRELLKPLLLHDKHMSRHIVAGA
jgi:hypothetical protein